jgi:hypothetical protein
MPDKIKILYVAANPRDTGYLRLAEEARELTARIQQSANRDSFEVIYLHAVRPQDLLRKLQEEEPHILHFSGHGSEDQEIVLETENGTSQPIDPQDLADLVEQFKTNLKVAVMSCCFGRRQAAALNQVLDFTIGMNNPISDLGAVNFSANFYQVLASGGSINQAFEGARVVTRMQGRQVFEKSDLLVREGADANEPFINLLPPAKDPEPQGPRWKTWAMIGIAVMVLASLSLGAYKYINQKLPPSHSFRYWLIVQQTRAGQDYQEPFQSFGEETFANGDKFQLNVATEEPGYLYIFNEGQPESDTPGFNLVYPNQKTNGGSSTIGTHQPVQVDWITFRGPEGAENFWIVWSASPVAQWEGGLTDQNRVAVREFLRVKESEIKVRIGHYEASKTALVSGRSELLIAHVEFKHH